MRLLSMSGSPVCWRVALALEHKALPYQLELLSMSAGDLRRPEVLALNPRGRVPILLDGDVVLYESAAIVEYLEDAYPTSGMGRLLDGDPRRRAVIRRTIREVDSYLAVDTERLVDELIRKPKEAWNALELEASSARVRTELTHFEQQLRHQPFLCGQLSAADHALYPFVMLCLRMERRFEAPLHIERALGPALRAWCARMEALPYFEQTYPPHWREQPV